MSRIEKLLDKLFPHRDIGTPFTSEPYLKRWHIWPRHEIIGEKPHGGGCIFLHRFNGDEYGNDVHDHP